jgi:hypothetical protein
MNKRIKKEKQINDKNQRDNTKIRYFLERIKIRNDWFTKKLNVDESIHSK